MASSELSRLGRDAAILFHRASWWTPDTLPVVGLDVVIVQDTLYTLKALDQRGQGVANVYLRAVQCAQLAHDRLLRDLREIDAHLSFWQSQVATGSRWSHGTFMLLSRGPLSFAEDVLGAALRSLTALRAAALALLLRDQPDSSPGSDQESDPDDTQRGEGSFLEGYRQSARTLARTFSSRLGQALLALPLEPGTGTGAGSGKGQSGSISGGGGSGGDSSGPEVPDATTTAVAEEPVAAGAGGDDEVAPSTATDLMQQRVLLLRCLRQRLVRALAQLMEAAAHLRLGPLLEPHHAVWPSAAKPGPTVGAGTRGFAASGAVPAAAAASVSAPASAAAVASGSGGSSTKRDQRLKEVEEAVQLAVHGMVAALEGLVHHYNHHNHQHLHHHHHHHHHGRQDPHHSGQQGSGSSSTDDAAARAVTHLAADFQRLLDLLRLHPLATPFSFSSSSSSAAAAATQGMSRRTAPAPQPAAVSGATESGAAAAATVASKAQGPAPAAGAPRGAAAAAGLHVTVSADGTARSALDAARRSAALSGPLLPLPPSARMPSRFQRYWLRYLAASCLAAYAGVFLFRHSRLAGSGDLDRWICTAVTAVQSAFRTHVAEPLAAVHDELFHTFRDRPAIVSSGDFALSRESLLRMLADFAADHPTSPGTSPAASSSSSPSSAASGSSHGTASGGSADGSNGSHSGGDGSSDVAAAAGGGGDEDGAVAAGMSVLMRCYEGELQQPLKNLLLGDLARALLIQVQHVKVDGEAAMLRLDQILRANELSISLMAALPALGLAGAGAWGLARLLIPRAPDPLREAVPSRLAMAALEVALEDLVRGEDRAAGAAAGAEREAAPEEGGKEEQGQVDEVQRDAGGGGGAAAVAAVATRSCSDDGAGSSNLEELRGLVAYRLYRAYSEITALYQRADRSSRTSEWRQLHADLLRLAAPGPSRERLATLRRIMRTYTVFRR